MRPGRSLLILLATLAGCGGGSAPLPSVEAAKQALQSSLDAWKAGRPASSLTEGKPRIEAVDFEWKSGKVLESYTLGAQASEQGTQTFAASLKLKGEPAAKDVKYMVLGLDPVHIYRDEDYTRAMNMDNAPATPKPKSRR